MKLEIKAKGMKLSDEVSMVAGAPRLCCGIVNA